MHHSDEENSAALSRHFMQLDSKYGPVQAVLLVNQEGVEAPIGQRYERFVEQYNRAQNLGSTRRVGFERFDFHNEC